MDDQSQQVRAALAQIWERSKGTILNRVVVLEQATLALLEGVLSEAVRQQAEHEAHKLTGSLGTFGFAQGSRLARKMEVLLQAGVPLGQAETLRLAELVVTLRQKLEHPSAAAPADPVPHDKRPLLLVVDTDTEFAEQTNGTRKTRKMA